MSDLTSQVRSLLPGLEREAQVQIMALIAIAEALERIAATKEQAQAEDSRRRASARSRVRDEPG